MAKNSKTTTKTTTTETQKTTQVRSREPQSLNAVFDRVIAMQEAKKKLDAELKGLRTDLLEAVKGVGGEYIRNGMKAKAMPANLVPNGKLVTLKEVLKAVPKRYHSLILADKKITEHLRTDAIKENNVKVTIN